VFTANNPLSRSIVVANFLAKAYRVEVNSLSLATRLWSSTALLIS
jgi:hypothetical protein